MTHILGKSSRKTFSQKQKNTPLFCILSYDFYYSTVSIVCCMTYVFALEDHSMVRCYAFNDILNVWVFSLVRITFCVLMILIFKALCHYCHVYHFELRQ